MELVRRAFNGTVKEFVTTLRTRAESTFTSANPSYPLYVVNTIAIRYNLGGLLVLLAVLAEIESMGVHSGKAEKVLQLLSEPHERVKRILQDERHSVKNACRCKIVGSLHDVVRHLDLCLVAVGQVW